MSHRLTSCTRWITEFSVLVTVALLCATPRLRAQSLRATPFTAVLDTMTECDIRDFTIDVENRSGALATIDSVEIVGTGAAEFKLRQPALSFFIGAGATMRCLFRLSPTVAGNKRVTIRFFASDRAVASNLVDVRVVVTKPALIFTPIGVDFGPVLIGDTAVQRLKVFNSGRSIVTLSQINFSTSDTAFLILGVPAPVTLHPGDSAIVPLRFTPQFEKQYRTFLQVHSDDCNGLNTIISVDGIGAVGTIAQIAFPPVVRGKPGSTIGIPLLLLNRLPDNPSNSFVALVQYDWRTLLIRDVKMNKVIAPGYSLSWKQIALGMIRIDANGPVAIVDSGLLCTIVASVYIGDRASFPLELPSFGFTFKRPYVVAHDGMFYLDSICYVERRLITEVKSNALLWNFPNPVSATTTIRYRLGDPSTISLDVIDPFGRKVLELDSGERTGGTHSFTADLGELQPGTYFIRLRTRSEAVTRPLTIIR